MNNALDATVRIFHRKQNGVMLCIRLQQAVHMASTGARPDNRTPRIITIGAISGRDPIPQNVAEIFTDLTCNIAGTNLSQFSCIGELRDMLPHTVASKIGHIVRFIKDAALAHIEEILLLSDSCIIYTGLQNIEVGVFACLCRSINRNQLQVATQFNRSARSICVLAVLILPIPEGLICLFGRHTGNRHFAAGTHRNRSKIGSFRRSTPIQIIAERSGGQINLGTVNGFRFLQLFLIVRILIGGTAVSQDILTVHAAVVRLYLERNRLVPSVRLGQRPSDFILGIVKC